MQPGAITQASTTLLQRDMQQGSERFWHRSLSPTRLKLQTQKKLLAHLSADADADADADAEKSEPSVPIAWRWSVQRRQQGHSQLPSTSAP
jgi:hypothetical protein